MTNTDTPAVKLVDTQEKFNAVDVAAWLRQEECHSGVADLVLSIHARAPALSEPVMASVFGADCVEHAYGATVAGAVAALRAKIGPLDVAARKREQAAKLLREAEKLEVEAANV